MNKNIYLACVIAAAIFPCNSHAFNGFYLGAGIGGSFNSGTEEINSISGIAQIQGGTFTPNNPSLFVPLSGSANVARNNVKGIIFAGYGHNWHPFYLGGEVFADFSQYERNTVFANSFALTQASSSSDNLVSLNVASRSNAKIKLKDSQYGIDLRPGFTLNDDTLFYGRIGVVWAKMTLDTLTTSSLSIVDRQAGNSLSIFSMPSSNSRNPARLRLGGGIERFISSRLSVRLDYVFTDYGSLNTNTNASSPVGNINIFNNNSTNSMVSNVVRNTTSVKLKNNTVLAGISYYFS